MLKGFQWFRFTFREKQPKLVYFVLNVTDRDVPLDVDIFQLGKDSDGQPDVVPFNDGEFVYQVEATQNYPGLLQIPHPHSSTGTGVLRACGRRSPGLPIAYLRIQRAAEQGPARGSARGHGFPDQHGRHLAFEHAAAGRDCAAHDDAALRDSALHCLPSIAIHNARLSERPCRTATLRRSARDSNFLSIAFTTTPGRLYGEPNTNWVRIIYTARTEASRLPLIAHAFEQNVTHDPPRKNFDLPYARFLKIHYKGVTVMPGDEADGCEPDVSPFEIATQSWHTFDLAYNETHDAGLARRARPCGAIGGAL